MSSLSSVIEELIAKKQPTLQDLRDLALLLRKQPDLANHHINQDQSHIPLLAVTPSNATAYVLLSFGADPNRMITYLPTGGTYPLVERVLQRHPSILPLLYSYGLNMGKKSISKEVEGMAVIHAVRFYLFRHCVISERIKANVLTLDPRALANNYTLNERTYPAWLEILRQGFNPAQPNLGKYLRQQILEEYDPSTLWLMIVHGLDVAVQKEGKDFLEYYAESLREIGTESTQIKQVLEVWRQRDNKHFVIDAYNYNYPALVIAKRYGRLPSNFSWRQKYERDFGQTTRGGEVEYRDRVQMPILLIGDQAHPIISSAYGEGMAYALQMFDEWYKLLGKKAQIYAMGERCGAAIFLLPLMYHLIEGNGLTIVAPGDMPTRRYYLKIGNETLQFDSLDFLHGMLMACKLSGIDAKERLGTLHRLTID